MKKLTLFTLTLSLFGADTAINNRSNIEISTIRKIHGSIEPLQETRAQLRAGYIRLDRRGEGDGLDTYAWGAAAHLYADTRRWHGLRIGAEGYALINPAYHDQSPETVNTDFFPTDKQAYLTLSQAFVDGAWNRTRIRIGRQILDTPHADSDDVQMMPNYFMAYVIANDDLPGIHLKAGYIEKMAGWENGGDPSDFRSVDRVLGTSRDGGGVRFASVEYNGLENFTLQAWYYHFDEISRLLYLEGGLCFPTRYATVTVGLQYDGARQSGRALLGPIDSDVWGASVQIDLFNSGVSLLGAYNAENGTGAFTSLGGGPFFTSMEINGIDGMGPRARAWVAGIGYDFAFAGIGRLNGSLSYGTFRYRDDREDAAESDLLLTYDFSRRLIASFAAAYVDKESPDSRDRMQIRLIAKYNFTTRFKKAKAR